MSPPPRGVSSNYMGEERFGLVTFYVNKRFNHGSNQPVQTTVIQINHIEDRKKIGTREILMFMPKIYADVSKTRLGDGV